MKGVVKIFTLLYFQQLISFGLLMISLLMMELSKK